MVTPQSQNVRKLPQKRISQYSHQSVDGWFTLYVFSSKNILTKLVGYQQPTCLFVKMEFVVGTISLPCDLYSLSWSCFRSCGVDAIVWVPCKRRSSVNSGAWLRRFDDVTGVAKIDIIR